MSDFASEFKSLADSVSVAAKGALSKLDQWSFKLLVDNLKQNDFDVVKESVDQMVREKKPISIAPLYFVSKMHPNPYCRQLAAEALKQFGKDKEIELATAGKQADQATLALIEKFGNYRN